MGVLDLALVESFVGALDGALAQNQPRFSQHDWLSGFRLPAFGADRLGLRARIQRTHGVRPTIGRHVRTRGCDQLSSASGTVLFQLHEGTCAFILDRTPGWTEIELDNGNVGWIPEPATEDV